MIREGYIEKIVYKSDETGYCVMSVEGEEGEEIFVGTLPGAGEGLYVIAEGEYVNHPQYDIQFKFSSCDFRIGYFDSGNGLKSQNSDRFLFTF